MAVKVGEHLDYMKDKLREEQGPPNFKNAYNIKHFERTQKYIGFLIDAKYYIECKSYDESHSCIAAALEALFLYKKQISIADKSPFNWETVDRLGGLTDEATVRKVEAQIAEEKKNKKKDENSQSSSGAPFGRQGGGGQKQQNQQQASGNSGNGGNSGTGNRNYAGGPCLWCHGVGHIIKGCPILKADYDNGDAGYDPQTNRFYRISRQSGQSQSSGRSEREY